MLWYSSLRSVVLPPAKMCSIQDTQTKVRPFPSSHKINTKYPNSMTKKKTEVDGSESKQSGNIKDSVSSPVIAKEYTKNKYNKTCALPNKKN